MRLVRPTEADLWADVAAEGWGSESSQLADFVRGMGRVSARARGMHCFLAELNGTPIAAGGLSISGGVAILAGASTIPSARRRGAQRALLDYRLSFAAARGIDLAMVVTQPDSGSQRNAEKSGFSVAYGRVKWAKPAKPAG